MKNITLRKHYCKHFAPQIKIYDSPYFESRLELFGVTNDYREFINYVTNNYKTIEDYLNHYNQVQEEAIKFIKSKATYDKFIHDDMNYYSVKNDITSNSIYKDCNNGRRFISIDMISANFSALKYYEPAIFPRCNKYSDFIKQFTDNPYFIKSKRLRQIIFGNCNPKRQMTFEKYIMNIFLEKISQFIDISNVVSLSNDEIVIDVTDLEKQKMLFDKIIYQAAMFLQTAPLRVEIFDLYKIPNTHGFAKHFFTEGDVFTFKCLNSIEATLVERIYIDGKIKEEDKVFVTDGMLVKMLDESIPEINLDFIYKLNTSGNDDIADCY